MIRVVLYIALGLFVYFIGFCVTMYVQIKIDNIKDMDDLQLEKHDGIGWFAIMWPLTAIVFGSIAGGKLLYTSLLKIIFAFINRPKKVKVDILKEAKDYRSVPLVETVEVVRYNNVTTEEIT